MKTNHFRSMAPIFLLLATTFVKAQDIGAARFADYLNVMPAPKASMTEFFEGFGNNGLEILNKASDFPRRQRELILLAFLEMFKANCAAAKASKTRMQRYAPEEQAMMQSFQQGLAGLTEGAQLGGFVLQMEGRPLVGSRKMSWCRPTDAMTNEGKGYLQQLLAIEKELNWPEFRREATERDMLQRMFAADEEISAINRKMKEERAKVPVKKVKLFEGMDATADVQDPEQMLKLIKATDAKLQSVFQARHTDYFTWWARQAEQIRRCALRIDALLDAVERGSKLQPADRQLLPMMADVQERIWQAIGLLNSVTRTMFANAQTAAASHQATEQAKEVYDKMGQQKT